MKNKAPSAAERLYVRPDGLYARGPKGEARLIKSKMQCSPYSAELGADGVLSICVDGAIVDRIPGVACWHCDYDLLVYTTANALAVYSMSTNKKLFYSRSVYAFEYKMTNEEFNTSASLIGVGEERYVRKADDSRSKEEPRLSPERGASTEEEGYIAESDTEGKMGEKRGYEIVEVPIKGGAYPFVFIRTVRQLFLYRMVHNALRKVFVPRYFAFDAKPSMFCMGECVYLRAQTPFLVFLKGGVFMHRVNCRFAMGAANASTFYFIYKGHLITTKLPGPADSMNYHSSLVIRLTEGDTSSDDPLRPDNCDAASGDRSLGSSSNEAKRVKVEGNKAADRADMPGPAMAGEEARKTGARADEHPFDDSLVIPEGSPSSSHPRRLVYSRNAIIVAAARYAPFTYVPFIPMVHIHIEWARQCPCFRTDQQGARGVLGAACPRKNAQVFARAAEPGLQAVPRRRIGG